MKTISLEWATEIEIKCSLCGKTRDAVKKIIAGPDGVYICNECIDLCNDIILEDIDTEGGAAWWPWRRRQ